MPSKIEYVDDSINFVTGCRKISPGCQNCYAETMTNRLKEMGQDKYKAGFNQVVMHWDCLQTKFPKKPTRYFVNSMSDTFNALVTFEFLYSMFKRFIFYPWHTFMIFTKRPERASVLMPEIWFHLSRNYPGVKFPLDNVWLIVTTENQDRADHRIPYLLKTPAAVRGLSLGPLLGKIDLSKYIRDIDWIAVEGESGSQARPLHPSWVRFARDQCWAANVPLWFKQWGSWGPHGEGERKITVLNDGRIIDKEKDLLQFIADTPTDKLQELAPRTMFKLGKKKSGNTLDGRTYQELPIEKPDRHRVPEPVERTEQTA